MALELNTTQIIQNTLGHGDKEKQQETADVSVQTAMFTKANSKKTWLTAAESLSTRMARSSLVLG